MYGTQASNRTTAVYRQFENDVKMYGTQAAPTLRLYIRTFENDVKMYGTQAHAVSCVNLFRLRMM